MQGAWVRDSHAATKRFHMPPGKFPRAAKEEEEEKFDAPFVSNPTHGRCTVKSTGWVPMFFQNSDLTYELCAFGESDFTSLNLIMTCTMGKIIDRWRNEMRSWKHCHNTPYFIILLPYAL